jgi:hypothetical protein
MNQLLKLLPAFVSVVPLAQADLTTSIFCNLAVFTKAERARHIELIAMLTERVAGMRESTNGYSFRFDAELVGPLAEWTTLETKCCPFLDFEIELEPQPGGAAWLHLRGNPEVKEFIRTDFQRLLKIARAKAEAW